MQWTCHL